MNNGFADIDFRLNAAISQCGGGQSALTPGSRACIETKEPAAGGDALLRWPEHIRGCPHRQRSDCSAFQKRSFDTDKLPSLSAPESRGIADVIKVSLVAHQAHVIAAEQT
jgi:hypothetical protein